MVENSENQNALLELIVDLKVEALAYQKQADDDHEFALHMMEERDSFERDLAKLERENEELTNQRDMLREQIEALEDAGVEYTRDATINELKKRNDRQSFSIQALHTELTDAQADRDIATNKYKELEEELEKVEVELAEEKSQREIAENDVDELQEEICKLRVELEGVD